MLQRYAASRLPQPRVKREPAAFSEEWLKAQFHEFLQQLQQKIEGMGGMEGTEEGSPQEREGEDMSRIRPVRTPRSEVPLESARPAELLRPEFSRGRLYFSCPACHFPAALPVWLAGKKARCPRCYSAIRAPHPRKGLNTRVLENDVESILHPERFSQYYNAHRLIPWLGIPLPKFHPSFHTTGVAILLVALALWIPALWERASHHMARMTAGAFNLAAESSPDLKDRARSVVEQFLAADNVEAKSAYVRDPGRVKSLMADWYQRRPGEAKQTARAVDVSGAGFYAGNLNHPVSDVRVELPDGKTTLYTVEHLPEGDRIEWETSVGYTADFASLIKRGPSAGKQPMRVLAALDDYYNYSFSDPSSHVCIRLHDPATLEFLGYGYVPATIDLAGPIAAQLAGSSIEDLRPLTIEVQPVKDAAESRQVEITRLLQSGWRTGDGVAAAPEAIK